jgi:spore coat protein YutH
LSFSTWLYENYNVRPETKRWVDGKECYQAERYIYFITSVENNEIIHMEQSVLAYYLKESSYSNMAIPIRNQQGEWLTSHQNTKYMVIQGSDQSYSPSISSGTILAQFHQIGSAYTYEPKAISSYGQWKQLWIEKVTALEQSLEKAAQGNPNAYYRLVMDTLPYFIGVSENAIQYIRESEEELRFHEADQGTIAFRRYSDQLYQSVMWPLELVYDHPARDIAEFLRQQFLQDDPKQGTIQFLRDYETVRPLSIFTWRLVYARLLFPIHLFDCLERNLTKQQIDADDQLHYLLQLQAKYEKHVSQFFDWANIDCKHLQIPVLHWL